MRARKIGGPVLLLLLAWCLSAAAVADLAALRDRAEAAARRGDVTGLEAALGELAGRKETLAGYYRAYAHYRLGELLAGEERRAKGHLNDCIDELKSVTADRPEFAEASALLATCYGVSAPYYMLRAATRGMAANGALERAMAAAPDNPRVILADGISLYFRPGAFGGDPARAATRLAEALARYADYRAWGPAAPGWGEAEAWLYLGRIRLEAGDPAGARTAVARALALAPDYQAARQLAGEIPAD